jgi:cell migration-inducing and hyaluronan-binding protein
MVGNVYPGYVPNAEKECMGASTFWIAHPNNTFVNNSAAGSISNGFHFVFHRVPTGPSAGTLPEFHGERTTIPLFKGNRAHSNLDNGLLIDRGVKVTPASQEDPREFLALVDTARYMPHVNQNPLGPREPAYIIEYLAYKNSRGAVVRGGDVWIQNSKFTDNDVAFIANSDDQLPYDSGSHQQVTGSVIVATDDTSNAEWQARSYPSVGVQLRGGPVVVDQNTFYGYTSTGGREAYAVGFYPQNPGQFGTSTYIGSNTGDQTALRVYFGRRDLSSIYGSYDADGDYFQVFYDSDGSLTGVPEAYAVRLDNLLLRGDTCTTLTPSNAAACVGNDYGQIFINAQTKTANVTIQYASEPAYPVTLQGVNKANSVEYPATTQYQAAVIVDRDYVVNFGQPTTPSWIELSSYNFPQFGYAVVGVQYPGTAPTFDIQYIEWRQMANQIVRQLPITPGTSLDEVKNDVDGLKYFWDGSLVWVKLLNRYAKDGYNYCAAQGCQFVRITTN